MTPPGEKILSSVLKSVAGEEPFECTISLFAPRRVDDWQWEVVVQTAASGTSPVDTRLVGATALLALKSALRFVELQTFRIAEHRPIPFEVDGVMFRERAFTPRYEEVS